MTGPENGESRKTRSRSITPTANLVDRYAQVSPNYGIYPPRRRFASAFKSDDYRQHALAGNQLPLPASLAISVRIPSAANLHADGADCSGEERLEEYLGSLYCELALQGLLYDSDRVVDELHIRTGRATQLGIAHVQTLMTNIQRHFTLQQAEHREFSIFAGALSGHPDASSILAEPGLNRVQLGLVGPEPDASSRWAALSFESAAGLTDMARGAGIRTVGADLCYGLIGQTMPEFEQSLKNMMGLRPDRIAIRDQQKYRVERDTSTPGRDSVLPGPAARFDMALSAFDVLDAEGYRHLGSGHFVLCGDDLLVAKEKMMLQYATRGYSGHGRSDSIGLGAAAISHVHNCYAENVSSASAYMSHLKNRRLPVINGLEFPRDERIRAAIIQTVMCQNKLVYKDIERQFDIDFPSYFADEKSALDSLERDGLIDVGDKEMDLTPAGDLMRSQIARAFDSFAA